MTALEVNAYKETVIWCHSDINLIMVSFLQEYNNYSLWTDFIRCACHFSYNILHDSIALLYILCNTE